jgi:hypothetical protein
MLTRLKVSISLFLFILKSVQPIRLMIIESLGIKSYLKLDPIVHLL